MLDIKPLESGDWKYELLVGECFHGCLHYGWYCQKIMQFGIFVFEEVHEINIRDNCQVINVMEISNIILPQSIICSFTKKACKFAIKRDSIFFLKFPKD